MVSGVKYGFSLGYQLGFSEKFTLSKIAALLAYNTKKSKSAIVWYWPPPPQIFA